MTIATSAMNVPLRCQAPDNVDLETAAVLFSSLSNPIRLGVLLRLLKREWSVNELANDLGLSQSALSQHLAKLKASRVVRTRRDRQTVFYHCNNETVVRLLTEIGLKL